MSLLKLKSIFSPTNTKFQDSQTDLSTFPRQFDNDFQQTNLVNINNKFDNELNLPLLSSVLDFDSIYNDNLVNDIDSFVSHRIDNINDSKLIGLNTFKSIKKDIDSQTKFAPIFF